MVHGGRLALVAPGQLAAHCGGIDGQLVGHAPEVAGTVGAFFPLWLVDHQHFHDHLAGGMRPFGAGTINHHSGGCLT